MKKEIRAVLDSEIDELLKKLGLYHKLQSQSLFCKFCKGTIISENIYAIYPESGDVKIVCNNHDCIDRFNRHQEGRHR